jgi:ribonucleoside-diphosphate reductase alpha chain
MRVGKNESLYQYLSHNHPELVEDDFFKSHIQAVISVPQKSPNNAIMRNESALDMLERVRKFNTEWVKSGHRKGANTNNVSATVSIKPEEWKEVGEWMWKYNETFNGLSVIPFEGGSYIQAPFEDISQSTYYRLEKMLTNINLTKIKEISDETDLNGQVACSAGACEIT